MRARKKVRRRAVARRRVRVGHTWSSSWGVLPPYKEFVKRLREEDEEHEGQPYLAKGQKYPIEEHSGSAGARVLAKLKVEPTGVGGHGRNKYELTEKQLYSFIKRAAKLGMSNTRDEEMREEAMSLSSAIMGTLGYEWI
jgi:hypothetical protein